VLIPYPGGLPEAGVRGVANGLRNPPNLTTI
jgi:hypothetical protein